MASSYSLASSLASTTNKTSSSRRNNKATPSPPPPVQALHLANSATITTPGSTSADSSGSAPGSADEMQPAAIGIPNSSSSSGGGGFARCSINSSRPFKTFEQGGGEGLRSPPSASPSVSYNCLASLVAWDAVGGGGGGGGDHNGVNGDDPSALAPDIYYDNIPRWVSRLLHHHHHHQLLLLLLQVERGEGRG